VSSSSIHLYLDFVFVFGLFTLMIVFILFILFNFYIESYIFDTTYFSWAFNFDNSVLFSNFPVIIYANADTQKLQILKENKARSGIYLWKNNINGKTYIGSSINLGKRLTSYYNYDFLSKPQHKMRIYKALLKYGYSKFRRAPFMRKSSPIPRRGYSWILWTF
jgi:hypothetical protein